MRTTDFSKAPALGQAEAMFTGAAAAGPAAFVRAAGAYRALNAALHGAVGHVDHFVYYSPPLSLGVIAYFDSAANMERFFAANTALATRFFGAHGWTQRFGADAHGYSNGVWRAEENRMAHIPRFTPTPTEKETHERPPRVSGAAPAVWEKTS